MQTFILQSYKRYKDASLISFFDGVIEELDGNQFFNDAASLRSALQDKLKLYREANAIAINGTSAQKATRNTLRAEAIAASQDLTVKLEAIANSNRDALLTTGYKLNKDHRTPVVVEPVKSFEVVYGQMEGQIIANAQKAKKGKGRVVFQYSLDAEVTVNTRWIAAGGTDKSATINSLPVGKTVWVRAGVMGSKQQAAYCSPIAIKVR